MSGGNVNITIVDGGAATIIVPGASVQLVIGTSSTGTAGNIVATRTPATLTTNFGVGPLPEAAAMACGAGGTVIAIKATSAVAGSAGTVTTTGAGTSVITVTGTPVDTYFVKVLFPTGGTIGVAGITLQISVDAGRNFGPVLAVGTASAFAITGTGLTLNFAAGTVLANETVTFSTNEPYWNTAGVQAALNAFQQSQYAVQGVGSVHIVGEPGFAAATGASCTTIEGYLDTLATGFIYTRAFMSARDVSPAAAYSGTGETESTWITSLQTDYAAVAARRMCVGAAYWNMPSVFPQPAVYGAPAFRRPIAYAAAARQVTIPPQRHLGRVKDGSLSQVVVNASVDPTDGFIYHDERINGGLDYVVTGSGGRFMTTMTRIGLPGVYIANPLTQAPLGSDFYLMPLGNVMDVFSGIVRTTAQQNIDDDVRLNTNGTIYENDARNIEGAIAAAVNAIMFAQKMISAPVLGGPQASSAQPAIVVDRTVNVRVTNTVVITGSILARGYVLTENITVGFTNPSAAI